MAQVILLYLIKIVLSIITPIVFIYFLYIVKFYSNVKCFSGRLIQVQKVFVICYNISEDFSEETKIPSENALSDSLNVSRVVVREALTKLRSEKIIVTYQGKGSFKANPRNFVNAEKMRKKMHFEDFKNVVEFRSAIECAAVNSAIKEASDAELRKLTVLVGEMERLKNDFAAFNLADYEFHLHIVKCSHNVLLLRAFDDCSEDIIATLAAMNDLSDSKDFALKLHREMADALIHRNLKNISELMKNNSEYNLARMSELLQ